MRGEVLVGQVHLHDGRIVGNGDIVHHTNVFDVRSTKQNVVVDSRLGHDRIGRLAVLRAKRPDCLLSMKRENNKILTKIFHYQR